METISKLSLNKSAFFSEHQNLFSDNWFSIFETPNLNWALRYSVLQIASEAKYSINLCICICNCRIVDKPRFGYHVHGGVGACTRVCSDVPWSPRLKGCPLSQLRGWWVEREFGNITIGPDIWHVQLPEEFPRTGCRSGVSACSCWHGWCCISWR